MQKFGTVEFATDDSFHYNNLVYIFMSEANTAIISCYPIHQMMLYHSIPWSSPNHNTLSSSWYRSCHCPGTNEVLQLVLLSGDGAG